jgi:hypothetical protein
MLKDKIVDWLSYAAAFDLFGYHTHITAEQAQWQKGLYHKCDDYQKPVEEFSILTRARDKAIHDKRIKCSDCAQIFDKVYHGPDQFVERETSKLVH